jgi:cyclic pyranopterin monophosphate synthase
MSKLTHLDDAGAARMVDVSDKSMTAREATAEAIIALSAEAYAAIASGDAPKGDVLAVARLAGIMGAKKTSELIPLCHQISLAKATVDFELLPERNALRIMAAAKTIAQTGVEMEALTAASIAALAIYDMTKAIDHGAVIETIRLLTKSGGKSGEYVSQRRSPPAPSASPARSRATPAALMHEASAPRAKANPHEDREAFRAFMVERHLRATQWAKEADVPVSAIYAFLTGRTRALPRDGAERLARAARVRVEEMFAVRAKS